MAENKSIELLYTKFGSVFRKPSSFKNAGCCVSQKTEREILNTPLRQINEFLLSALFTHSEGCFGEYTDAAYYLPRLIELFSLGTFEYGTLSSLAHHIFRNRERYESFKLFDDIVLAMLEVFKTKTDIFNVDHYDEARCKEKGWCIKYDDFVLNSEDRDELLGEFFLKLYRDDNFGLENFFRDWYKDKSLQRKMHFLDFCAGRAEPALIYSNIYTHPVVLKLISDKSLLIKCFQEAEDLRQKIESPTYERDIRQRLQL